MPKQVVWVLVIAAGVFLGVFAYEKFTEYRMARVLEAELVHLQATVDASTRQLEAERARKRAAEVYSDTACAINEDAQTCVCIHEKTGARMAIGYDDCVKRAQEITW